MKARHIDLLDMATMRHYAMPGECLETQPSGERGTVGIFGIDRWTGRHVAITAMHVIPGIYEYPHPDVPHAFHITAPCVGGAPPIVGQLVRGTRYGIDAAAFDIHGQSASNFLGAEIGTVRYWRSVHAGDNRTIVRMVGAVSQLQWGTIVEAALPVPDWGLDAAIVVDIHATYGDSGAPLVDAHGNLIGLLVGGNNTRQLFSPIEAVFDRMHCQLLRN